jgi:hypothetical protein
MKENTKGMEENKMGENLADRIKRLETELRAAQDAQAKCRHEFSEPVQATREVPEAVYDHLEPHGSDPEPIYRTYISTEYGWERTCMLCGYSEYTTNTRPVIERHEPDFENKRKD